MIAIAADTRRAGTMRVPHPVVSDDGANPVGNRWLSGHEHAPVTILTLRFYCYAPSLSNLTEENHVAWAVEPHDADHREHRTGQQGPPAGPTADDGGQRAGTDPPADPLGACDRRTGSSPPGSADVIAFCPPCHPRSSRVHPARSQPSTKLMAFRFRRGKSRESGLFGGSLFLGLVLDTGRRSSYTLLLHKVKCSNSAWRAYAESTSERSS
jgi:hypothetical protein